ELVLEAAGHPGVGELAALVEGGVGLGAGVVSLPDCGEVGDFVGRLAVLNAPIGRFQEAVLVGPRIERERVDQADVRPLGRFNRAYPPIVGGMYVTHLKARALARQAAGPERRDAPLVRDLG